MKERWTPVVLLAVTGSLLCACGSPKEAAPAPVGEATPAASPAPESIPSPLAAEAEPATADPPALVPDAAPTSVTAVPAPPERPATKAPPAAAVLTPAARAVPPSPPPPTPVLTPLAAPPSRPTSAPAPAASAGVVDPGGEVAVPPGKAGLTRIGAEKCRLCHKVQHASWATTAHAKRTPALDCESCHGPGSEYKALAVMKDPAKARAAGLVEPDAAFCGRCHKGKWDPALLGKVHAHKAAS